MVHFKKERTVPPTLMRDYGERHGHASGVGESKRVSVAVAHVQQKYRRKCCVETREDYRKDLDVYKHTHTNYELDLSFLRTIYKCYSFLDGSIRTLIKKGILSLSLSLPLFFFSFYLLLLLLSTSCPRASSASSTRSVTHYKKDEKHIVVVTNRYVLTIPLSYRLPFLLFERLLHR